MTIPLPYSQYVQQSQPGKQYPAAASQLVPGYAVPASTVVGSAPVNIIARHAGGPGMVETICRRVRDLKNALTGVEVNQIAAL